MNIEEFTELRLKYFETAFIGRAKSTVESSHSSMNEFEDFLFLGTHGKRIDLSDPDLFSEFLKDVWKRHKREGPRRVVSGVTRFIRWLLRAGYITRDPSTAVTGFKVVRGPTKPPITRADYDAIMAVCDAGPARWLIMTAWATGMAMVDICFLSLDEIDLENLCITKRRKKSDSRCIIPIETGSDFHKALIQQIKNMDLSHPENDRENEKYYLSPELKRIYSGSHGNLTTMVSKIFRKAGVDKRKTFHSFRVAYCSMLANGDVNLGLACKMTGHKNPGTFAKRYLKVKPEALHQALTDARNKQAEHEQSAFLD